MIKWIFALWCALLCIGVASAQTPCFTAAYSVGVCPPPMVQIVTVNGTAQLWKNVSGSAGTTITASSPANTTKGNSILCLGLESAAAIPTFTDASNTYVSIVSSATAPGAAASIAQNIAGGAVTTTETVTNGAAGFTCYELSGVPPAGLAWDVNLVQQGTGGTIPFAFTGTTASNEMIFTAAGFTTGQTVNATPLLGSPVSTLNTVDYANQAVTGGAALAVFYAAHGTLPSPVQFTQSTSLSASVTYSGLLVSIKPTTYNLASTGDPCNASVWKPYVVNVAVNTQIIAGAANTNVFVCGVTFPNQAVAVNVNIVESATSGNACATSPTGMLGGATAALGANIAINQGWTAGYNGHAVARTATAGDAICIFASASAHGIIWYVQQ
jgi:hypothetical protein